MKILIVDLGSKFNNFGGQARMAAMFFEKLKPHFDTYYLGYRTLYSPDGKNSIILERGKHLNVSVRRSWVSEAWPARFAYNLLLLPRLWGLDKESVLRELERIKPDIIMANSIQDINLLKYLKKRGLKFKSIYIDHGSVASSIYSYFSKEGMPLTLGTGIDSWSTNEKKKKFFRFYDMNIVFNASQLRRILDFTLKARMIPHGMDVKVVRNTPKESKLRKAYGIDVDDFVILYVGRLFERQKNISTLIRAFRGIDNRKMKLLVAGDGPNLAEYKKLANGDARIVFAGSLDEETINYAYNISDVFVLPSLWESFGLTVLEAAAHSLPLILSNNAYLEVFRGNDIGTMITFNPHEEDELRKAIFDVYQNLSIREYAKRVSKKIAKKFTVKSMIEGYVDVIEELNQHV